ADGRGVPRRQAGVRDQLAVRRVGRPVLPERRRRLAGQDRRRHGQRWDGPGPPVLPARRRLPRPAGAPDPAAGRRRVVRLVLLPVRVAELLALAGLGAFHGLNPAMGWLFAVARGMQERSRTVLLRSLPPIAAGHLASVAIVAAVVSATRSVVTANVIGIVGGMLLVGYGLWR